MKSARWLPALLIVLLLAACGESSTGPADGPGPGVDPDPDPTADTFCGRLGYPCSIKDVDPEVATRSEELLTDLKARVESGESSDAAASWIAQQDGVVDVAVNESAILFRLAGGQPTWLLTPPAVEGTQAIANPAAANSEDVVGHGTLRDNAQRKKKALILTPFEFDFKGNDPGPTIFALLLGVPDYAGGVKKIGNLVEPTLAGNVDTDGSPTVEDFMGWGAYDVIAVNTHGGLFGLDGEWTCGEYTPNFLCLTGIATGQRVQPGKCNEYIKAHYPTYEGIRCTGISGVKGVYLLLDSDFFSGEYSSLSAPGLDKTIIYMGACNSYRFGSSLAYHLGGNTSAYFGWDGSVISTQSGAPAIRLFQLLVLHGLTTVDAFEQLENEGKTSTSKANLKYNDNDGLRIREITNLKNPLHPSVSNPTPALLTTSAREAAARAMAIDEEGDLKPGDILPFFGQAGDGQNDQVFFYVDVDGIRSGHESEFDVTVTINGEELGTWPLDGDDATRIMEYRVRLRIQQPLDFDVQPGATISLRATTNLPGDDDAESYDEVSVMLANPQLHIHSTIETSGGGLNLLSEVDGEIELSLEPGDNPDDLKLGTSMGPLRYVKFQATVPPPPGCTITTQTFDGRMVIREGAVSFDDTGSGDFGVPTDLVIFPLPEIRETLTTTCSQGTFTLDLVHWFSGFASFHGGGFGGSNELDESRGGFVVTGWEPGSDDVYSRKTYDRSGQEDDVTVSEQTTLELRGPSYTASGAATQRVAGRTRS